MTLRKQYFELNATYLIIGPLSRYDRSSLAHAHDFTHFVETRIHADTLVVWYLVRLHDAYIHTHTPVKRVRCQQVNKKYSHRMLSYSTSRPLTGNWTAAGDLPEHKGERVYVSHFVRFKVAAIQRLVENFGGHVAFRSLRRVGHVLVRQRGSTNMHKISIDYLNRLGTN